MDNLQQIVERAIPINYTCPAKRKDAIARRVWLLEQLRRLTGTTDKPIIGPTEFKT
jgi:hypothetical protein